MDQPDLLSWEKPGTKFGSNFDGSTFDKGRDAQRLRRQLTAVFDSMKDGAWRTLARIHAMTGAPEASISARIRDLKKSKFGGHTVERRFVSRGLWEYRVIERPPPS